MPEQRNSGDFSVWVTSIFIFNLIVGTGALALPAALAKTGWLLGSFLIILLSIISYATVTFIIETIAITNAIIELNRIKELNAFENSTKDIDKNDDLDEEQQDEIDDLNEQQPLCAVDTVQSSLSPSSIANLFTLNRKFELGDLTSILYNNYGRFTFYVCLILYLYGDLSIYTAVIAKSLRDVICNFNGTHVAITLTQTKDQNDSMPCWPDSQTILTRFDVYRITVIGFISTIGPFVFFNVQKTKYIQLLTIIFRWLAFSIMIAIAIYRLFTKTSDGHPAAGNLNALPALFGTCVYSFMCHHSVPNLIGPISSSPLTSEHTKQRSLNSQFFINYAVISMFYLLLGLTGTFAFAKLDDLYTLNFMNLFNDNQFIQYVELFLALFPVFTLSTSYPIIAITLRENITILMSSLFFATEINEEISSGSNDIISVEQRTGPFHLMMKHCVYPFLVIIPPTLIAFTTNNLEYLIGFTGSYAGIGIQYLIPVSLVFLARRKLRHTINAQSNISNVTIDSIIISNQYNSPFKQNWQLAFVIIWSFVSITFITVHMTK